MLDMVLLHGQMLDVRPFIYETVLFINTIGGGTYVVDLLQIACTRLHSIMHQERQATLSENDVFVCPFCPFFQSVVSRFSQ